MNLLVGHHLVGTIGHRQNELELERRQRNRGAVPGNLLAVEMTREPVTPADLAFLLDRLGRRRAPMLHGPIRRQVTTESERPYSRQQFVGRHGDQQQETVTRVEL